MSKTMSKWYARPVYVPVALALVLSLGIVALPIAGTVEADGGETGDWYEISLEAVTHDTGTFKSLGTTDADISLTLHLKSNFYIGQIHEWVYDNTFQDPSMDNFYLDKPLKPEYAEWSESTWCGLVSEDGSYAQAYGDPVWPAGMTGDNDAHFCWTSNFDDPADDFSFDIVCAMSDGSVPADVVYNAAYSKAEDKWTITVAGSYTSSGLEVQPLMATSVGPDEFYTSIQDGIDNVAEGGTVYVAAGTYTENVLIDKPLTLQGDGSYPTIRDNGDRPIVIKEGTSSVTIKGFTIVHATETGYGAIRLVNDKGNPISDLTIEDNKITQANGEAGIYINLGVFDGVTIKDNVISGLSNTGVMIMVGSMTRLNIEGNVITGNADAVKGLYVQGLTGTALTDNTIKDNVITGFSQAGTGKCIEGSNNNYVTVSGNTFTGSGKDGISWWVVTHILIENNTFEDNTRYGINIKGQDIDITRNTFKNNRDSGVLIAQYSIPTQNVTVNYNNIFGNGIYGVNNDNSGMIVDATNNWWGDESGPNATTNLNGTGDNVSTNVTFFPWALNEGCTNFTNSNTSVVVVDDDWVGYTNHTRVTVNYTDYYMGVNAFATIQDGVDAVDAGGTVNVAAGTYAEHLIIEKSNLNLIGEDRETTIIDATQDSSWTVAKAGILIGEYPLVDGVHGVKVSGFTIRDAAMQEGGVHYEGAKYGVGPGGLAGIQIYGSSDNTVEDNILINNYWQIWLVAEWPAAGYTECKNNRIANNIIRDSENDGVYLYSDGGVYVENTEIVNNEISNLYGTYASGVEFWGWPEGGHTPTISGTVISGNHITSCTYGVRIRDDVSDITGTLVNFNNFIGNTNYGVYNGVASTINATNNWWGRATGPYNATSNPHGTGDAVSDDVDFVPWLDASGGNATGGLPATLLLSASETSVVVGGNTSLITATLTDTIGNPIYNTTLDYAVTTGDGTLSPASGTTDDWGHDTTRFASPTLAEINTVTGWYRPDSTVTASVNIDVTPGPLARVETTPVSTHAVVVGDVNIVAELMDTYRNHIDATDASEVSFATTGLGSIGVTSVTADDKIQMVYTTDDSMATDTITATTTTGNYTDFSVVTTYGATPATMTFKAADSRVVVSDTTNTEALSVALFDQYGNPSAYSDYDASPQEFYEVIFTWSSGAGIVEPNTAAVNANGYREVTYKSSTVIGDYTVTATSGDATKSLVITQTRDVLAAVSLTPDTASCVGGQDITLTAELLDRFANHIDATDVGDVTPNLLTGRGILGTPSLDTIANVVKVVYTTYISEADTAEIEATATTFKDTSVVISALAGTLDHFALALDTDSLNVGTAVTVTITAEDIDSVRIYTYDNEDIIALTLDGTAAEASQVMWVIGTDTIYALTAEIPESTFTAGQVDVTIVNEKAEAVMVIATDTAGITGTSDAIAWIPITLDHFGIVVQSEPIYTGVPFTFTVIPYDEYENVTSVGLPVWWIEFGTNESGVSLPAGPLQFSGTTDYSATASNASTSLILTVGTTDGLIHGISDTITVIGLYTLSGTVGLADNPGDLSGTEVMVTGGFSDTTDAIGYYEIPGLLTGTYNIIVTHEGYHTIIESGVDISANIVKNFVLQPVVTGIEEIPTVYSLSQNKPNPFAGGTTIEYGIPKASNVEIVVYNAVGQKVRTLVSAEEKAGYHKVSWDVTNDSGAKVGGGIYFYKITAGEFTSLKKLILLK